MREWRDIKGYEGLYKINSQGEVKSLERKIPFGRGYRIKPESFLSWHYHANCPYPQVTLSKDGKNRFCLVHRLVAEAFVPNPYNYPIVNHIDENKNNPCAENLEWCDGTYNNLYGNHSAKQSKSLKAYYAVHCSPHVKPVVEYKADGSTINYSSMQEAALKNNIAKSWLCNIVKREKLYKGSVWKYADY